MTSHSLPSKGHVCEALRCTLRVLFPFHDLDDGAERTLRQLADGSQLGGEAPAPEGGAAQQRDLDRLEKGADRNLRHFPKGKSKALRLGRNKPLQQDMLGDACTAGKAAVQTPGVMAEPQVTTLELGKQMCRPLGSWRGPR